MRKYRTTKEVPWMEILRELRWYMQYQMNRYQQVSRMEQKGWEQLYAMNLAQEKIQTSLQAYTSLRNFLGYSNKTVLEKEIDIFFENS